MGWASGGIYFDVVAYKLIEMDAPDEIVTEVCAALIEELRSGDWDTADESLGAFEAYPAIVEAFRQNGIWTNCHNRFKTDEMSWYMYCTLEKGHSEERHRDRHER